MVMMLNMINMMNRWRISMDFQLIYKKELPQINRNKKYEINNSNRRVRRTDSTEGRIR